MDGTGLSSFSPSVGRLRKLEVLSLAKNNLTDLPVTLGFCENLKTLNLQGNKFRYIPGIVLHLDKLEDLRRLDNPLPPRWSGFETAPHINTTSKGDDKKEKVYNPDSLQTLCTRVAFTNHIDYWKLDTVGPLQCKILDSLASQFVICENCHAATPKRGTHL